MGFILLLGTAGTCQSPNGQIQSAMYTATRWLHSHEEDHDSIRIYRPQDFNFPPSRGRSGFELNRNGEALFGQIAPTDGIVWIDAQWKILADSTLSLETSPKGKNMSSCYRLLIIEAGDDKLSVVFWEEPSCGHP